MFKAAFVLCALEQSFSGGFLTPLGDTVLLDLVCLSLFCSPDKLDDDQIRARIHKDSKNPLRELLI